MKKVSLKRLLPGLTVGVFVLGFLYTFGGFFAAKTVIESIFDKRMVSESPARLFCGRDYYPALNSREDVTFASGNEILAGSLYKGGDKGLVLFAHGLGGNRDDQTSGVQSYFVERGYSLFSFDLTASGASSGKGIHGLHQSAYDVKAALDYLSQREDVDLDNLAFMGFSWGAYGIAASLNFDLPAYPKALVSFAGFDYPESEMVAMARRYVGSLADFSKWQFDWALSARVGGENAYLSACKGIKAHPEVSLSLVQGDEDETVPLDASLFEAVRKESVSRKEYLRSGYGHRGLWLSEEARDFAAKMERHYDAMSGDDKEERFAKYLEEQGGKKRCSALDLSLLESLENDIEAALEA